MQHKHIFAALLCGALCLTGCLKNEESASVTQVRNAKANELNANAELLKAQAAAETVLANAQAELLKAQAELQKALAAKENAQAEYVKAETELKKVEAELAAVDVDIKKVDLEIRKAELEAILAHVAAEKAAAEAQLAEIALQLQGIQAQMQIDAIQQSINLLIAQAELEEVLFELEESERQQMLALANQYFEIQSEILELSIQIFENQLEIAELEAGIKDPTEVLANEIAAAQRELARMEYMKETAQQYLAYTEDEWKDAKAVYTAELLKAQNDYLAAYKDYSDYYYMNYVPAKEAYQNTFYFDYDEDWYYGESIATYARALGAEERYVEIDPENEVWAWQWGYYDENAEWTPLFTEHHYAYELVVHSPDEETVAEAEEKGIYLPNAVYQWLSVYQPGMTDVEAFNTFVDAYVTGEEEAAQEDLDEAKEASEFVADTYKARIAYLNAQIKQMEAYVASISEEFDAADAAVLETAANLEEARGAYGAAVANYDFARINNAEFEEAVYAYVQALEAEDLAQEAYNEAKNATAEAKAAESTVINEFVAAYAGEGEGEEAVKSAEYKRDLEIAMQEYVVKQKKAAVTEEIETAYKNAVAAVNTAKDEVAKKEADVESALATYHAAEIVWAADQTNEDLILKKNNAKDAYDAAVAALKTAKEKLAEAQTNESSKKEAYDAVNEPLKTAEADLKALQDKKAEWDTKLLAAATDVDEAIEDEEDAKELYDAAKELTAAAKEDKDAAEEALAADEKDALDEAEDAMLEAEDAYDEAVETVDVLEATHVHYRQDVNSLDPENPMGIVAARDALVEASEDLVYDYAGDGNPVAYADYVQSITEPIEELKETAKEWKAYVAQYEEQYRPAYVEAIDAYNEANKELLELYFMVLDNEEIVEYLELIVDMIGECTFADEDGNIVSVEEYIANIEEQEEELIESINKLWNAIVENNIDIEIEIARLELENSQMEDQIAILSKLLEEYAKILNEWLGAETETPAE